MLKAALWYAKREWYVVPLHTPLFTDGRCTGCSCEEWRRANIPDNENYVCKTPGKHPRMREWEAKATIDPEQIRRWWKAWPDANIGIAPGRSGLIALDADKYKAVEALPLAYAKTITSLTGGGGEHLIYQHPGDTIPLGNSKGDLPAHIDVRGWGGQFVAPPSLHPSGRRYEWEDGYAPHQIAPLPLPDTLKRVLVETAERLQQTAVMLGEMETVSLSDLEVPNLVMALLLNDRSRIDECVITSLVKAGLTDNQILWVFAHHAPTEKFSEKNGNGMQYLAASISHARAWVSSRQTPQRDRAA